MRSLYKKLFLGIFCCSCLMAVSGQSIYTYYINYVRYNNLKQELIKTGSINLIR